MSVKIKNVCPICHSELETELEEELAAVFGGKPTSIMCEKCQEAAREAELSAAATAEEESRLERAKIPPEFRTYDKAKGNYPLFRWVWDNRLSHLMVVGPNDTGKTRALAIALVHLVKRGEYGRFIRFSELAAKYAAICKRDSDKSYDWLMNILDCGTLIVDDIGKRRITETAGELLYEIFDRVYAADAPCRVWFTLNITLEKLTLSFERIEQGNAVVSRIDRLIEAGRMKKWQE